MKNALFGGKNKIVLCDKENRKIRQNEVAIKVEFCGICGTDVNIYNGLRGSAKAKRNVVLGHEFSGTITEVGKRVKGFVIGDKVCVDPNLNCGNCAPCREGLTHYCENMTIYGINADGGFKEECLVNERAVYKLENKTSLKQAALAEPVGCCLHGIDMCNIEAGSQVVIVGGGMIGLIMVQLAKLNGAAKVALIEPVESKHETAKKLGADLCINPIDAETITNSLSRSKFNNIKTVIECVGKTNTIETAINICGNKGTVLLFGLTAPNEKVKIKPYEIFKKELTIKSSYINPKTHQRALDLLDTGRINVTAMIHKVVSLEELESVLENDDLRSKGKILVSPTA